MGALLALLPQLLQAVGPVVLGMVQQHVDEFGKLPTPEELKAKIDAQADAIISKGEDWLKNHPQS